MPLHCIKGKQWHRVTVKNNINYLCSKLIFLLFSALQWQTEGHAGTLLPVIIERIYDEELDYIGWEESPWAVATVWPDWAIFALWASF